MDPQSFNYWMSQSHYISPQQQQQPFYDAPPEMSKVPSLSGSPVSSTYDRFPASLHQTYYPHVVDESMQVEPYHIPMTPSELGSDHDSPYCSPRPILHVESSYMPGPISSNAEKTHAISGRRRAQNRAAQRAFRERKEKHAHDLEVQLTALTDKYNKLEGSHTDLRVAHEKLRKTIEILMQDDDDDDAADENEDARVIRRKSSSAETLRKLLDMLHGENKVPTPVKPELA